MTLVLVWLLIAVGGVGGVVVADGAEGTVSPVVADATGEQVVVVEVESDWTAESTPTTVEQLEQRATRNQAPLRQYAERTPGVIIEHSFWLGNLAVMTIDHSRTDVTDLAAVQNVVHIGPNFNVSANRAGGEVDTTGAVHSLPSQTLSGSSVTGTDREPTATDTTYGLDQINATEVWSAYGTRGEGVSVAVLDTGIDTDHPDLSVEKWQEFDGTGNPVDSQPNDGNGHGTHVSGTVTGAENPAGTVPSFGVAPEADLYGVKVLDDSGEGTFAQIIAGMQWAVDNDADIMSMSLGAPGFSDQFIDPVRNANTAGTLVVASAGNSGEGSSGSPGNVYDSIAVGASNSNQGIASFSSGEVVDTAADWSSPPADWPSQYVVPDIAAPGVGVLSSVPGGGYDDTYSGTSMAAPHVSGAAALLQSATARNLSVERIETLLVDTATKPDGAPTDPDTRYGNGIIDAKAAVDLATRAKFTVSIVRTNAPIVEGELLNVATEIQNTGDVSSTQTITLDVGSLGTDSTSVTLSGGASTNVTLAVGTGSGDAGEYTATASSPDDTAATSVTVLEPANFVVSIADIDSEVTAGETLAVDYGVTNTGDMQATQDIEFTGNGSIEDTEVGVTLSGSETFSGQFSYTTGSADTPMVSVAVASEDDAASETVTVNDPAVFDVAITSVDSAVTAGEAITASYEVTNTGDVQATQDIEFTVNGTAESTEAGVTLNGSETVSGQFTYDTGSSDTPAVNVTVASNDNSATETVTVNEPAAFDVTIMSVNPTVTEGETITLAYEVQNTGDATDTQDIGLAVNGTTEDTASGVTLDGSETLSDQFSYETAEGDSPAVSVTVSSADDSATKTVTVNEPANFDVTLTSVDSAVTKGEAVTVAYEVTNTGDVADTQDITFAVNGTSEDTETGVTLNGSETFSGQFVYETGASDIPEITVAAASADDTGTETVTVNEEAIFAVAITSVDTMVTEGETITVAYEVTNTGDVEDTQDIGFAVNGTTEDTEANVTLAGGETFSGQFTYATVAGDASVVSVTVSSADDSATESVVLNEPSSFDVTLTSVDSAVTEGETITVAYEVTNTGDVQATQDIGFAVNGTAESTEAGVTLNGSETFSDQFTYDTGTSDAPAVSVAVSSAGDSETETVTVNEPASFDLTITSVDSAVTEGETITVSYELQNTGDVTDTQEITFAVNGTAEDTASGVTLDGSETFSGQFTYTTVVGDAPAVSVAVSSADDSATETVTVNKPSSFDVTLTSVDSAVTEGETITVAYEVTNTGDVQDTQDIGFAVNGTTEDTASGVTLNGSETFSGQFTYATAGGDAPAVSVAVLSADDSATQTVTVNEPASLDVTLTSVDSAVTEGEIITVAYEVTNTGDQQGTQDITFAVNGTTEHTETGVTLNGSETFSGQFSYATSPGDAPAVTVAMLSADDSATQTVTVNEPASLDVTITSIDSAVTEGETITVAYEVTNTGDVQDTQDITFAVNGTTEDTESGVTLNGSETFSSQFTYITVAGDAPAVSVAVSSADNSDSNTVTVNEPSSVVVEIVETNTPVEGEQLTVTASIENTGDVQDTQTVTLDVGPLGSDSTTVTLGGGASTNVTLSVGTGAGDAGEYIATVSSADDSASANVTVLTPAEFTVNIVETTTPVEGESLSVTANIQNIGDLEDTQEINLSVGTLGTDSVAVTLSGGASTDVTLSVGTGAGDAGAYTVTVASEDDTASANVTVNEPSSFDVTITSVDAVVTEGETITVAYEVTNIGDVADTQDITFAVNGTTEDTASSVTLNGSETVSGQFTYATAGGDVPAVSVAVSSADDSATETVTVNELAEFDVTLTSVNSTVTAGETITASYEVTNTGDVADTQDIGFAVNGTTEDTASGVTLNGSETVSGQFTHATAGGDAPAVSVAVSSADNAATETVTVTEPASFDMIITSVDSAVTERETITVAYEVTNTGDVADTQDITFAVNGTAEDTASGVMLNGSETFNGQFTYDTVTGDAPVVSVTVSSANDTATATVTVTEPANFDVNITSVDSEVTEGETITVGYEVTNIGDVARTQDITFAVNGTTESAESGVTLNGSETVSDQFSYDTVAGDAPAVNATVSSADDTASANVTVLAPAVFTVDIVETTTPVEGETLNVTAGIENTGAVTSTQAVTLDAGALGSDSKSVTLDGGGSTNVTLSVGTAAGDAGAYTATVSSANATTSANVTVLTPAQFVVSNLTAPAETTVGASITVSATVTNIGETDGPQTVAFRFDGQTVANRTVSLTPDASTTVTFTPTVPDQTGTFEHGVFTADDNQTAEITIVDPEPPIVALSNLRIAGQENTTTVFAGSYNVSVTVSHDGGPDGAVPVELTVGPTIINETVTLNASETTTVTFENATGDLSPGSYDVTVSAVNASVTGEVTLSVPVGDNPNPATDTDDDGLLEDTDGDGEFTIFDVQTFFIEFQSDPVQTNSALFNFDGSGDGAVTIFDVQALFLELAG